MTSDTTTQPASTARGVPGFGMELLLDLGGCNPGIIRSGDDLIIYVGLLAERIGMTTYGDPVAVRFGNGELAGWTVVQLITTSNINLHAVEDDNSAHVNVFSCKKFDHAAATAFTVEFFGARAHTAHLVERTAPTPED